MILSGKNEENKSIKNVKRCLIAVVSGVLVVDNVLMDYQKTVLCTTITRAESSLTNKIQGTGLRMAITKNLVEAMGGTIDVDSELGQGSCFEVFMDLKIAEDRTVTLAAQEETDEQDGNILQGMRFLCAEDNELNAEILTELLKIEGAECIICENGEEILKAFEQSAPGDYDMILMDIQMPVMNGYEATKAIRRSSHKLAKTIPIIAMTANAFSEDIQHSLAAGMNAHVSKPVEMDTVLFSDTIQKNLQYARENATMEQLEQAVQMSCSKEMIHALPQGYHSVLEVGGRNISQGQRQLLAIARAFVADPGILILDVATSNVDTRTEKAIQSAMHKIMENRTSIVIAHRLSTIRDSDLIVVMDQGKIVEQGTHEGLLEHHGKYYSPYMTQFAGFAT